MKKLFLLTACVFSLSAQAEIRPGFSVPKHLKGKDARGEFDISYVQISPRALPNTGVRSRVNKAMLDQAKRVICDANAEEAQNMSSTYSVTVTQASPEMFAVRASFDVNCGGAHPDNGTESAVFDLRSGKQIEVEKEATDGAAFRAAVVEKLLANKPALGEGEKEDEGCYEFYTREHFSTDFFEYGVKDGKLVVTPSYPHVILACAFDTEIPLSELKGLFKPGSVLQRVAQ